MYFIKKIPSYSKVSSKCQKNEKLKWDKQKNRKKSLKEDHEAVGVVDLEAPKTKIVLQLPIESEKLQTGIIS